MKSFGCDNRDQLVDRCSEWLTIFQELRTFVRFCVDLTWDTVPQNLVLIFQVEYVFGQQAIAKAPSCCGL